MSIAAPDNTATKSVTAQSNAVTEGTAAVFTLTRTGSLADALTVNVSVTESGAMLKGTPPATVTFAADSAAAELAVETDDDEVAEAASTITAAVSAGSGYSMDAGAPSATVTVEDDDAAPVVTTASPVEAAENGAAIATLQATDDDTLAADLAWSIAGGSDAAKFTLGAGGELAFASAKDFEAPDDADRDGGYEVTVRVTDGANPVDATLIVRLTDVDEAAPVLAGASVADRLLTLSFDEVLDEGSTPEAGAFAVAVDGTARSVSSVSVSASTVTVTLTLASVVVAGETVTVGYTVPTGANARPLRDVAGNPVAGFNDEAVTNDTSSEVLVGIYRLGRWVPEGHETDFMLVRFGDTAAELTVDVSVTESGAKLDGTPPSSVTFAAGSDEAKLIVKTEDDTLDEPDSEMTVTIVAGTDYRVSETLWGGPSVTVTVGDNDYPPEIVTPSPIQVAENRVGDYDFEGEHQVCAGHLGCGGDPRTSRFQGPLELVAGGRYGCGQGHPEHGRGPGIQDREEFRGAGRYRHRRRLRDRGPGHRRP